MDNERKIQIERFITDIDAQVARLLKEKQGYVDILNAFGHTTATTKALLAKKSVKNSDRSAPNTAKDIKYAHIELEVKKIGEGQKKDIADSFMNTYSHFDRKEVNKVLANKLSKMKQKGMLLYTLKEGDTIGGYYSVPS